MNESRCIKGVNISGTLPILHPDSWVEAPVIIQANLASMNLIQIGAFTGIYGGKIGHCKIGRYCSIAPGVDIASDQHPTDWLSTSMLQYVDNLHNWGEWLKENGFKYVTPETNFKSNEIVKIGNDVWIGQGVFIKSGVEIGNGAIIAAHAVITSNVPPYAVVAGVPGKVKRYRFSNSIIENLEKIRWWDYNISELTNLRFNNIHESLERLSRAIDSNEILPFSSNKYLFTSL